VGRRQVKVGFLDAESQTWTSSSGLRVCRGVFMRFDNFQGVRYPLTHVGPYVVAPLCLVAVEACNHSHHISGFSPQLRIMCGNSACATLRERRGC